MWCVNWLSSFSPAVISFSCLWTFLYVWLLKGRKELKVKARGGNQPSKFSFPIKKIASAGASSDAGSAYEYVNSSVQCCCTHAISWRGASARLKVRIFPIYGHQCWPPVYVAIILPSSAAKKSSISFRGRGRDIGSCNGGGWWNKWHGQDLRTQPNMEWRGKYWFDYIDLDNWNIFFKWFSSLSMWPISVDCTDSVWEFKLSIVQCSMQRSNQ